MTSDDKNQSGANQPSKFPPAGVGNASNPSPQEDPGEPGSNQLFGKQAETYLREGGNIEDMPDEQDWQEADETIKQANNDQ